MLRGRAEKKQPAVLATKFFVPRVRSDLVARPRLYARLDAGLEGVLTLVAAPAGSGKTTILADWLHAQEHAEQPSGVAWLSLDSGDNDPVRFLGYLTAAIQHVVPSSSMQAYPSPRPRNPRRSSQYSAI